MKKCQTFSGFSFSNVKVWGFSLFYVITHWISLGFGLLVGQNKTFKDVISDSGKSRIAVSIHNLFYCDVFTVSTLLLLHLSTFVFDWAVSKRNFCYYVRDKVSWILNKRPFSQLYDILHKLMNRLMEKIINRLNANIK